MKLTIEGTEEEIKNTLQAISGSKERVHVKPLNLRDWIEKYNHGVMNRFTTQDYREYLDHFHYKEANYGI